MDEIITRLVSGSVRDAVSGCLVWTGSRQSNGYGRIRVSPGKRRTVHTVAYEARHGAIPAGMKVCHTCDNKPCIEDAHHFLGTQADNMRDMASKGRGRRVERRTTCRYGHARSRENTRIDRNGREICRVCRRKGGRYSANG